MKVVRHHKGAFYAVVGEARDGNTGEQRVLYRPLGKPDAVPFSHTVADFERMEGSVRRFQPVDLERTLLILKPDVADQSYVLGQTLHAIELKTPTLKVVDIRSAHIDRNMCDRLYAEHLDKDFYLNHRSFMTRGRVWLIQIVGYDAVSLVRALVGPTNPAEAPESTLRGQYGTDLPKNGFHASADVRAAERELKLFGWEP